MFYTKIRTPSKGKSFPPPVPAANFIVWREMATWNAFIDLNAQKWLPLRHLLWYIRFEFHSCTFNILQLIFGHLRLVSKKTIFLLTNEMIKMCGLCDSPLPLGLPQVSKRSHLFANIGHKLQPQWHTLTPCVSFYTELVRALKSKL